MYPDWLDRWCIRTRSGEGVGSRRRVFHHSTNRITLRRFIRSSASTTSFLSSTASRRSTVRVASRRPGSMYSPRMRLASSTARMTVSWSGLFMARHTTRKNRPFNLGELKSFRCYVVAGRRNDRQRRQSMRIGRYRCGLHGPAWPLPMDGHSPWTPPPWRGRARRPPGYPSSQNQVDRNAPGLRLIGGCIRTRRGEGRPPVHAGGTRGS
jgi:hypothetical protein